MTRSAGIDCILYFFHGSPSQIALKYYCIMNTEKLDLGNEIMILHRSATKSILPSLLPCGFYT